MAVVVPEMPGMKNAVIGSYSPRSRASLLSATLSALGWIRASSSVIRSLVSLRLPMDGVLERLDEPLHMLDSRLQSLKRDGVIRGAAFRGGVADTSAVRRICRIRAISPSRSRMGSPLRRTFGGERARRIAPALRLGHLPDDELAVLNLFSDEVQLLPPFLLGAFSCRLRSGWPARSVGHRPSPFTGAVTFVRRRFAASAW